jgi:hypothetical protein
MKDISSYQAGFPNCQITGQTDLEFEQLRS